MPRKGHCRFESCPGCNIYQHNNKMIMEKSKKDIEMDGKITDDVKDAQELIA